MSGVPEGGMLPDAIGPRFHHDKDGETWIDLPPPKGMDSGGGAFRVRDYQDIPIVFNVPGEPPPPTRWQRFKSRMLWKLEGLRSRVAHWIYPEGFDDDW